MNRPILDSTDMLIRLVTLSDRDWIVAIMKALLSPYYDGDSTDQADRFIQGSLTGQGQLLIAEHTLVKTLTP